MSAGEYYRIPQKRQNEIIKIAKRKRRYLSVWQQQQVGIWLRSQENKKPLPEQQLFFMRDIENKLMRLGVI